jgi:hypothetical protein
VLRPINRAESRLAKAQFVPVDRMQKANGAGWITILRRLLFDRFPNLGNYIFVE